ncbi:MAG: hypothetical protein JWL76_195 [Thermoleophilia bacterium]|nr:hypothetical protein [Thermoleophilia bacterium]
MQLSPAAPRTAAPLGVTVNVSTALDMARPSTGMRRAEHLAVGFTSPDDRLDASVDVYDPLWDGPVAEPNSPEDWHATRSASASPAIRNAVTALEASVATLDLGKLRSSDTEPGSYATLHLHYAERPANLGTLRPYQERDGSWVVPVRTSIGDLFQNPALLPIVDAARAVLVAAR